MLFLSIKQNQKMKSINTIPPQQKYIEDKLKAWDRKLMQQEKATQIGKKKGFFSRLFS
jgi:hypothetical protein